MIFNVGYLILIAALGLAIFGLIAGALGGQQRNVRLAQTSYNAVIGVAILVVGAALILWYGLLDDQFQVVYVWNQSERALPTFYKIAALWGGQDGSLLFWTLLLSIYSAIVIASFRNKQQAVMPYVSATLLATSVFFLLLLIFVANPFEQVAFVPQDGQGLNPLLQNYWMVVHPVMLYLGYVGMVIPFAFAVGALISRKFGNDWGRIVRRWTLVPWMFLSIGIVMGSQWAYMELGWGGYWAWDPVENASFLPWLTATAFLHSIIIQEQRGALKVWNMIMVWLTYFLVILGTFTTRSGIIQSVHSFALSNVGPFFLGFLIIVLFGYLWLLFQRMALLRDEQHFDSYASREAAFLANNWLFAGIAFATLWGTFFPMFSELLVGARISVAAPYFNKVNGPLFLMLLLLMGVGPLLGWRRTSMVALRKQFLWPVGATLIGAAALCFLTQKVYPILGLAACIFVTATIVQEYGRGVYARRTTTGEHIPVAMFSLIRRNGRRYGGYIVHLGIVMMGVAIIGNTFYQSTTNITLKQGQTVQLAGYELVFQGMESNRLANLMEFGARVDIRTLSSGKQVGSVFPRRNLYDKTPDMPTSEVGLHITALEDVYVVLNGWGDDGASATFTIYVNPLTVWLWIGGIVLVIGTLLAIWPHPVQQKALVTSPASTVGAVG